MDGDLYTWSGCDEPECNERATFICVNEFLEPCLYCEAHGQAHGLTRGIPVVPEEKS